MDSGFNVDLNELRSHATTLSDVAGQVRSTAAGAQDSVGGAYGQITEFFASAVTSSADEVRGAINQAGDSVDEVHVGLQATADSYQNIDDHYATVFESGDSGAAGSRGGGQRFAQVQDEGGTAEPIAGYEQRVAPADSRAEQNLPPGGVQLAALTDEIGPPSQPLLVPPNEKYPDFDHLTPEQQNHAYDMLRDRGVSDLNADAALRNGPPGTTPMVGENDLDVAVTFQDEDRIVLVREVVSIDPGARDAALAAQGAAFKLWPYTQWGDPPVTELWIQVPAGTTTDSISAVFEPLPPPPPHTVVRYLYPDGSAVK
jgi:excreted virulence factor EspC (type VII ESX diderm)